MKINYGWRLICILQFSCKCLHVQLNSPALGLN